MAGHRIGGVIMSIWAMTAIIVYKSLWWIIPVAGGIVAMAITDER